MRSSHVSEDRRTGLSIIRRMSFNYRNIGNFLNISQNFYFLMDVILNPKLKILNKRESVNKGG